MRKDLGIGIPCGASGASGATQDGRLGISMLSRSASRTRNWTGTLRVLLALNSLRSLPYRLDAMREQHGVKKGSLKPWTFHSIDEAIRQPLLVSHLRKAEPTRDGLCDQPGMAMGAGTGRGHSITQFAQQSIFARTIDNHRGSSLRFLVPHS